MIAKIKDILKNIPVMFSRTKNRGENDTLEKSGSGQGRIVPSFDDIKSFFAGKPVQKYLLSLENRFLHHFPEKKRRPILFGIWGLSMIFLILLILIPVTLSGRPGQAVVFRAAGDFTIPAEELFFPSEPDFLPEFILEREPRNLWSLDDLRPYWRTLEHPDLWRTQIKSAVDSLMENVP